MSMWRLQNPTKSDLIRYRDRLLLSLEARVLASGKPSIKLVLLPDNKTDTLEQLLTGTPVNLHKLNERLMKKLVHNYREGELLDFLSVKSKKRKTRDINETILYNKYQSILGPLKELFDYEGQISVNKSRAYEITKIKGRNSCTYCNRQYSQTIVKNKGTNNGDRIVRPHLDHWFSQELFPLMSLSFYNLIPSCPICNSTAKGNAIFRLNTHIHPYVNTAPQKFSFSYKPKPAGGWDIEIENDTDPKEVNMIRDFYLREIYQYHADLELKDIMDFALANNETYINTLLNQTLIQFPRKNKADIYRMFFGAELHNSAFLDRPMSKFKYDILKKLGVIDYLDNHS